MSSWEQTKKTLGKILQEGVEEIKELAAETTDFTDKTARIVKGELNLRRLRQQLTQIEAQAGRLVLEKMSLGERLSKTNQLQDLAQEAKDLSARIAAAEEEFRDLEEKA